MTVNQLHKMLGKMIEEGKGRLKVSVDKESFWHPLESDGCVILDVQKVEFAWVPLCNDDGGIAYTKAGIERGAKHIVLRGADPLRVRADPFQNARTPA